MKSALISCYIVLAGITMWKFMYQRTALNVCRLQELPKHYKGVMVPYWHIVSAYPLMILKGVLFVLMWLKIKWYVPIIIVVADNILSAIVTIPHDYFLKRMKIRLSNPSTRLVKKEFFDQNEELRIELLSAINATIGE